MNQRRKPVRVLFPGPAHVRFTPIDRLGNPPPWLYTILRRARLEQRHMQATTTVPTPEVQALVAGIKARVYGGAAPAGGLTEEETRVSDALTALWTAARALEGPALGAEDLAALRLEIHRMQGVLAVRLAARLFPAFWRTG